MEPELSPQTENLSAQRARGSNTGQEIPPLTIKGSAGGKTCHQCRQTIKGAFATCKNLRKGKPKPCVLKFCRQCLSNRYGEDAQKVDLLDGWNCPKCRGHCNCSQCRIKKNLRPTGPLTHEARTSGFRSVLELLGARAAANLDTNTNNDAAVLPLKEVVALGEPGEGLKEIFNDTSADDAFQKDETNCESLMVIEADGAAGVVSQDEIFNAISDEEVEVERNPRSTVYQMKGFPEDWAANDFYDPKIFAPNNGHVFNPLSTRDEKIEEEIPLPSSTQLKEILGIEFAHEDVRNALQFLEFCTVFGNAVDMKKGEAETILRQLIRKQNLRSGENTLAVEFQNRLLTMILVDSGHKSPSLTTTDGNNSWLKALGDLASKSAIVLKDFPLEIFNEGISGYCNLTLSNKLRLLNFICDEVLSTEKVRNYIDEENLKIEKQKKEAKSLVAAAKEKEKSLKQKLQEELAKRAQSNGDPGSLSEQDALVQTLKIEVARAHREVLEAKGKTPKRKISDATRTEPVFVDNSGQAFWKLQTYEGENVVLLQDIKIQGDGTAIEERWFAYGPEKKHEINKYISSRAKRSKLLKAPYKLSNESSEANM